MLYVALFLSALIFLFLNGVANTNPRRVTSAAVWALVLTTIGAFALAYVVGAILFFPVVMIQCGFLVLVGRWWVHANASRPHRYLILSLFATIAAYATVGIPMKLRHERWRERFAFASIEERVPIQPLEPTEKSFHGSSTTEVLERDIERKQGWRFNSREHFLKRIHDDSVDNFVNSWGFGIGRIIRQEPSEQGLTKGLRTEPAPLQPANPIYPANSEGQITIYPTKEIGVFHDDAVLDFVHPQGFGYVKDRQHVAGFQSHRFSEVPKSKEVEVARLELVSLLMHKEPSVYLSDRLPQMDALKGVPTRPLDTFESEGLKVLRKGEDLYGREDRMIGSIRSTKQCLTCHGGDRGQLLGAFSYSLRPTGK